MKTQKEKMRGVLRKFTLVFVVLVIVLAMSFLSPVFMTVKNMTNILRQISINGILAVGMTYVILLGDIDLSVGSVVAVVSVICGSLLEKGLNYFPVCLIALGVAVLFGVFNGWLVAYLNFQPFIATLATVTIGRGVALAYSDGRPYIISNPSFLAIGQGYAWKIPIPVVILLVICAIGFIVLNYTTFGRHVAVFNPELDFGIEIEIDPSTLDHFVQWKMMGARDYCMRCAFTFAGEWAAMAMSSIDLCVCRSSL